MIHSNLLFNLYWIYASFPFPAYSFTLCFRVFNFSQKQTVQHPKSSLTVLNRVIKYLLFNTILHSLKILINLLRTHIKFKTYCMIEKHFYFSDDTLTPKPSKRYVNCFNLKTTFHYAGHFYVFFILIYIPMFVKILLMKNLFSC